MESLPFDDGDGALSVCVAALYRFARFADVEAVRAPLARLCCGLGVKGTLLVAAEGMPVGLMVWGLANRSVLDVHAGRIDNVPARVRELGDLWKPLLAARGRFDLATLI